MSWWRDLLKGLPPPHVKRVATEYRIISEKQGSRIYGANHGQQALIPQGGSGVVGGSGGGSSGGSGGFQPGQYIAIQTQTQNQNQNIATMSVAQQVAYQTQLQQAAMAAAVPDTVTRRGHFIELVRNLELIEHPKYPYDMAIYRMLDTRSLVHESKIELTAFLHFLNCNGVDAKNIPRLVEVVTGWGFEWVV